MAERPGWWLSWLNIRSNKGIALCTKHNYPAKDVTKLAPAIRRSFYLACSDRPGPILIDLPTDALCAKNEFIRLEEVRLRSCKPICHPSRGQLREVAGFILEAKHPLILTGGGVSGSNVGAVLTEFAELAHIPSDSLLRALGGHRGTGPIRKACTAKRQPTDPSVALMSSSPWVSALPT